MGNGLNQIQINMSNDRPANLTGSFQESDRKHSSSGGGVINQLPAQGLPNMQSSGGKGLFAGQHKIKINSATINSGSNVMNAPNGMARLNSEHSVAMGHNGVSLGPVGGHEAAMRNSHY